MAKKKSTKSGGRKKGGKGGQKSKQSTAAKPGTKSSAKPKQDLPKAELTAESKDRVKDQAEEEASKDGKATEATEAPATEAAKNEPPPPELVNKLVMVDNAIGYVEQTFLVLVLFSLIGVGTYQFVASHIFKVNDTWPFGALRNLVFLTAMGGAALAAQKGRMISMDFVARKFSPRNRVILRILITFFVVFTCYLLFKGGMFVRNAAEAHHDVFVPDSRIGTVVAQWMNLVLDPKFTLMMLPLGAALIAVHYTLHALTDALYLFAGLIPPEEEGPAGH